MSRYLNGNVLRVTCDPDPDFPLRRMPQEQLKRFQGALKVVSVEEADAMALSMEEEGFAAPVFIWWGHDDILDGHIRLQVCERRGWIVEGGVPVVQIEADTRQDAARKLLRVFSAKYSQIDTQGLYEFLETHQLDLDDLHIALPDFDAEAFFMEFYGEPDGGGNGTGGEDEAPPPPVQPVTRAGDLWLMGRHRLLCGDCSTSESAIQLFMGAQADMGLTSPPYAVGKEYEADRSFADHITLLEALADRGLEIIKEGGFFFTNFGEIAPQSHAGPLTGSKRQCLYLISKDYWRIFHEERRYDLYAQRIWYKPFNRLQKPFWSYHTSIPHHQEWEHIWTWRLPGGDGDQVFDWDISSRAVWDTRTEATDDKPLTRHVAAFPICLPERAIRAHSGLEALVWEPFCGSGTTIMAAHRLGRTCYATELYPPYVDVAVRRWQRATGQEATLDGSGATFAQVAQERGVPLSDAA